MTRPEPPPKLSTFLEVLAEDLAQHAAALLPYPAGAVADVAPNLALIAQGVALLEKRLAELEAVAADIDLVDYVRSGEIGPPGDDRPEIELTAAGYQALSMAPPEGSVVSLARAREARAQRALQDRLDGRALGPTERDGGVVPFLGVRFEPPDTPV
ncbi:hypothetical protein [Microcystis phage Mwe-JY25]